VIHGKWGTWLSSQTTNLWSTELDESILYWPRRVHVHGLQLPPWPRFGYHLLNGFKVGPPTILHTIAAVLLTIRWVRAEIVHTLTRRNDGALSAVFHQGSDLNQEISGQYNLLFQSQKFNITLWPVSILDVKSVYHPNSILGHIVVICNQCHD